MMEEEVRQGRKNGSPSPLYLVSVASTGLRYRASPLSATHTRGSRSVASKGLRLHQNCAECAHFRLREWALASPRSARKRCAKVPKKGVEWQENRWANRGESFPTGSEPSR